MDKIHTINELQLAQENDPELVKRCFKKVTVLCDLEEYLEWLADSATLTSVTTDLHRYKKRSLGIHPSSACKKGVCLLKLYYECTGKIPPRRDYDANMQRIWDLGTHLHDTYQAHFNSMYGDQFVDEVKLLDDELHIKSAADGLFTFDNVRIILEAKSIKEGGAYGWEKVQQKPFPDNVRQAHFYMKLADVPFAIIFYMNKNSGKLAEQPIMFDQDLWDSMQTEVVEPVISAAYEGGKMVGGTSGFGCKWCDFQHSCPVLSKERTYGRGSTRSWGKR